MARSSHSCAALDDAERRWGAPYQLVVHRAGSPARSSGSHRARIQHQSPNRGRRRGLCFRRKFCRGCHRARHDPAKGGGRLPDRRGRRALLRAAKARRRVRKIFGPHRLARHGRCRPRPGRVAPRRDNCSYGSGARRISSTTHCAAAPSSIASRSWTRIFVQTERISGRARASREFLEARFSGWAATRAGVAACLLRIGASGRFSIAIRVAERGSQGAWRSWAMRRIPCCHFWPRGAAQAIEDAGALGEVLTRGQNIETSLRASDQEARDCPRAARVQKESRRQAKIPTICAGPAALSARYGIARTRPAKIARPLRLAL